MSVTPGRRPPSVTRRNPLSPESSPSPPRILLLGRRRLWSPPPRKRTPPTTPKPLSRLNARSSIPKAAGAQRLQSVVCHVEQRRRHPLRSRLSGHRSHHDSRPPANESSEDEDARESDQRPRKTSPTRLMSVLSPPSTPRPRRQRPPPTQGGNHGSRFVASTIVATARKKVCPRPPTPKDIERVNFRLRKLAL